MNAALDLNFDLSGMKHTALHQNPSSVWPHQLSLLPRHDVYEICGLVCIFACS